ncbi:MAG: ubiquitin-like small modifier protein 1 [Halolamina sp.]
MTVEVRLFGPFRDDVGASALARDAAGETVGELLRSLEDEYDALAGRLVDGDDIAGSTVVTVDERDVRHREGLGTELDEGDTVRLTPSVYGG